MRRKYILFLKFAVVILTIVFLANILVQGVPNWCDRLLFFFGEKTEAEREVMAFAIENNLSYSDYPESLIALLERNPETKTFVLEYPLWEEKPVDLSEYADCDSVPLFLQWDPQWGYLPYGSDMAGLTACGPVCLSMAAYYVTGDEDFSPDKMIAFAAENGYYSQGNGSSWTLISEGGVKLGLDVTEIPLVKNRIIDNLEVGNPIICAMGPGAFTATGHYIVLTGYENGMLRVNDPNSISNSETLWSYEEIEDEIRNLWVIRK